MSGTPDLGRTQRLFWDVVVAPEGAAAGLAALAPANRAAARGLLRERPGMTSVERLDVYANMYFFRILDALKQDFPGVLALVGADEFHNLITDYLIVHPSRHYSLRYAGQELPAFARDHRLSQAHPYLADVAALEWAMLAAFDAVDTPVLDAAALARVAPEVWGALRFELSSSLHVLDFDYPADRIWQDTQAGIAIESAAAATQVRVWRREMRVYHRAIDAAEREALRALRAGATFADVCALLAPANTDPQVAAAAVFGLVRIWLGDGILAGANVAST